MVGLNAAYEELKTAERRLSYDRQIGASSRSGGGAATCGRPIRGVDGLGPLGRRVAADPWLDAGARLRPVRGPAHRRRSCVRLRLPPLARLPGDRTRGSRCDCPLHRCPSPSRSPSGGRPVAGRRSVCAGSRSLIGVSVRQIAGRPAPRSREPPVRQERRRGAVSPIPALQTRPRASESSHPRRDTAPCAWRIRDVASAAYETRPRLLEEQP